MTIPESLDDWTLEAVERIVRDGYHEDDRFDFKEVLDGQGSSYAAKIAKAACSFANTRGGFLLFGVSDRGIGTDRIKGIPADPENAKHVTDKLQKAEPSLVIGIQNPPIELPNGKVVLVVEIPRGRLGPHRDPNRKFWRRSQGTAVPMTYEEIRHGFVDHEERVSRLGLVFVSLVDNWLRLKEMAGYAGSGTDISLDVPDMSQVRDYLGLVNSLCPEATGALMAILRICDSLSTRRSIFLPSVNTPMTGKAQLTSEYNAAVADMVGDARPLFQAVLELLQERIGFESVRVGEDYIPRVT